MISLLYRSLKHRLMYYCISVAGTLELVNGTQPNSGRVELIRNGLRGTVCDDAWDDQDATVVCKMLGLR